MSLNKVLLIGNLTKDAEVRSVGQSQVAQFGLATSEKFRKEDGSIAESTEFHEIVLWNYSGIYSFLKKGQQVYIEGAIKTEEWVGNDGVKRSVKKIKAYQIQLLGNRPQQPVQQAVQVPQQAVQAPPAPQPPTTMPPQGYAQATPPVAPGYPQMPPQAAYPQQPPYPQTPVQPTGASPNNYNDLPF